MQEILGCGLGLNIVGDDLIEVQQFHSIWIGEGGSNHALLKCLAFRLVDKEPGGQMANVGRVILDANLFALAIDRDMGIEAAVVIDAGFKGDSGALAPRKPRHFNGCGEGCLA
jgi:hypothetical protein